MAKSENGSQTLFNDITDIISTALISDSGLGLALQGNESRRSETKLGRSDRLELSLHAHL